VLMLRHTGQMRCWSGFGLNVVVAEAVGSFPWACGVKKIPAPLVTEQEPAAPSPTTPESWASRLFDGHLARKMWRV
jgi:hypothetical protein